MENYHFVVYAEGERVGTADTINFAKAIEQAYQRIGKVTVICIESYQGVWTYESIYKGFNRGECAC